MRLIDVDKLFEACDKAYITTANDVITMIAEAPTIAINIVENEGLQAIATRVSTGDECAIIIEDGEVK